MAPSVLALYDEYTRAIHRLLQDDCTQGMSSILLITLLIHEVLNKQITAGSGSGCGFIYHS